MMASSYIILKMNPFSLYHFIVIQCTFAIYVAFLGIEFALSGSFVAKPIVTGTFEVLEECNIVSVLSLNSACFLLLYGSILNEKAEKYMPFNIVYDFLSYVIS